MCSCNFSYWILFHVISYIMQKGLTKVGFCEQIVHLRGGCNVFGVTDFTFVAHFIPNFSRRFASNYRADIFSVNKPE